MINVEPTIVALAKAQDAANVYLGNVLGAGYGATNGFYGNDYWYFLIRYRGVDGECTSGVGKIAVNAITGEITALTDEQLRDVREFSAVQAAQGRGELARDEQGYVLRYQTQMKASQWLSDNLTMHFSATDGQFESFDHPFWQFAIRFRLPRVGEIKALGLIDVDALTGKVTPLSRQQSKTIQERVRALIQHRKLASAP
jgi:hypothetical protein